jgi:hypothetical protein
LRTAALEYAIRRIQVNQEGFKEHATHQFLVYADDVNILGRSIHTLKKKAKALLIAGKKISLEINAEKKINIRSCLDISTQNKIAT